MDDGLSSATHHAQRRARAELEKRSSCKSEAIFIKRTNVSHRLLSTNQPSLFMCVYSCTCQLPGPAKLRKAASYTASARGAGGGARMGARSGEVWFGVSTTGPVPAATAYALYARPPYMKMNKFVSLCSLRPCA